ncbi:MAG: ABC transporter substrate-binding protein [Proteobacteria bacterium]|nr:ABC transporter substrate-binding protein [Pseudomonadota bacterium]
MNHWDRLCAFGLGALVGALVACTNNPYPDADTDRKIYYTSFREAPRTLDPAVAYTTSSHAVTGNVYDTLLEYHYLKRPYTLIPGLAEEVPVAEPRPDGRVAYRFRLRPDLRFHADPCFERGGEGRKTRAVTAADVAFELTRIADPAVNSPVVEPFSNLVGFREFGTRLAERREADEAFAARPAHEQYAELGAIPGIRVLSERELEIVLISAYPQILYWFAMPFTTPVPWEAVDYYDGEDGRPAFSDHPVGTGPYRLSYYNKQFRMVLEAEESWYGRRHPEWRAPGTVYPSEGAPGDAEAGLLDPAVVGRPLPLIERIVFQREKESIPRFNKFLQGYYDASGIIKESFDKIIVNDGLSPEMAALGIRLERSVEPSIFYLGFNMEDPVVGAEAGERGRALRQALSLAVDTEEWLRLFTNGRGVLAQSPLPPGLFGYDPDYRNPYRRVDLDRARQRLADAGYPDGIDPATGEPLRLTFDVYQTTAQQLLANRFYIDGWRRIGVDVRLEATNYNKFQEKVRNGAYQIFSWGWIADYPDPENFFFLLWSEMARSKSGGPNTANFSHPRFDELFLRIKSMENSPERQALLKEMVAILETERPWIEGFHMESYSLYHGWLHHQKPFGMSFPMTKYWDLDAAGRSELRRAWNEPVTWPVYALVAAAAVVVLPGIRTFLRERQ